jgi:hypothetical protein
MKNILCLSDHQKKYIIGILAERFKHAQVLEQQKISRILIRILMSFRTHDRTFWREGLLNFLGLNEMKPYLSQDVIDKFRQQKNYRRKRKTLYGIQYDKK